MIYSPYPAPSAIRAIARCIPLFPQQGYWKVFTLLWAGTMVLGTYTPGDKLTAFRVAFIFLSFGMGTFVIEIVVRVIREDLP